MSKKYAKSFTINGNQEMIFEIAISYLPVLNFTIQTSRKPVLIVAKRSGAFGARVFSSSIKNFPIILTIKISGLQNVTQIICEYEIEGLRGVIGSSTPQFFLDEVESLENYIFTAISQQSQTIQDPHSVQTQPSVNIHIGKVGDDISTIKDSVVQHSDIGGKVNVLETKSFKICPYCGKDLNLPKTPKFCPYCGDELS